MLMTSTRGVPKAPVDDLSDYDVVLVVVDIRRFLADRSWLNDFGSDPLSPNSTKLATWQRNELVLWDVNEGVDRNVVFLLPS
jgi:hypothetical protein